MKDHGDFMDELKHANSLPSQTARALAPESQEDIAMYSNDVLCEGGEE